MTSHKNPISPIIEKTLPWIVAMALFMQTLDATILNTALPAMAYDLNRSPLDMQSAVISYALTVALFIPVSGYLADKIGTRTLFISAVGLFSFGSLLCALSPTLPALVLSRVIQGIGGAMMTPVARLTLIKTFDRSKLLAAMSLATMPGLIGPVLGPLLGGYLVVAASWHWIFLINIPIGAVGIWFGYKFMPNYKENSGALDFVGFAIFSIAVVMLSMGLEFAGAGSQLYFALIIFCFGIFLLGAYVWYAKKAENPLFPMSLFEIRTFRTGVLGNLASRIGISSIPLLLPLLIQVVFLKSATASGWLLAPMAVAAIAVKPILTPLIRNYGYRKVLIFNTLTVGFIIVLLSIPSKDTPLFWWVPLLLILGAANSIQFTAMNTISLADLRGYQTSSGNSLIAVNQQLAISFGIAIGAALLRFMTEQTWLTHNNTDTAFRVTFIILGTLTMLSSLVFRKLHVRDGDNLTQNTKPH